MGCLKAIFLTNTKILMLTAFSLIFAVCADATTLNVKNSYWGESVNLSYNGTETRDVSVGEYDIYFDGNEKNILTAYCVDLDHPLYLNENLNYTVDGFSSPSDYATNGKAAEWLMDSFAYNNGLGYHHSTDTNPNNQSAALQLAIWEVLYGDLFLYDITSTDALTDTLYKFFIDEFETHYSADKVKDGRYAVVKLSLNNNDTQDLLIRNPVPEPTTMLLFGFGLLGIGALGRRKE